MISNKVIELLKKNENAKGRLATALDRTTYTVNEWIKDNHVMLTTVAALQIIREETGLTDDEILKKETA